MKIYLDHDFYKEFLFYSNRIIQFGVQQIQRMQKETQPNPDF
jgi:hypothetical protein